MQKTVCLVFLVLATLFTCLTTGSGFCNGANAVTMETETVRISFERTGGFAGIRVTTAVNTADLPPDEARTLHQLVADADFFHLPAKITSPTPQPDRFQYKLEVQENGRQHTVTVSEEAMPAALQPLVQWLLNAARREREHKSSQ